MKPGLIIVVVCLLSFYAVAQDGPESSELERSLSPQQLQQLVESRDLAWQDLHGSGDIVSPGIFNAFRDPYEPVAVATMNQVVNTDGRHYTLELEVEKVLRGNLPQAIAARCSWPEEPWVMRPPRGAQRIKPENGKRILVGFHDVVTTDGRQGEPVYFQGVLNLDDRTEAALLPYALTAAEMDTTAAMSGYEKIVSSENSAVRDLAFHRLMAAKGCAADANCEESILNGVRSLLAGKNPNDRMEAVQWLGKLADGIGDCQMMRACAMPQFHTAPVRELLQAAVADQNVAVGDVAFQVLATLDFHKKENNGYCEEIVPAMRAVKPYANTGGGHPMAISLSAASVCLSATK